MAVTEPGIGTSNWGVTLNTAITQLDTIGASSGLVAQTLAATGTVVFNALNGQYQKVTLSANATSSSITNPSNGQRITIQWLQDATGGRTYVWPTNCKFAGGATPIASTAAGKSDLITFVFDGTNWLETASSLGV